MIFPGTHDPTPSESSDERGAEGARGRVPRGKQTDTDLQAHAARRPAEYVVDAREDLNTIGGRERQIELQTHVVRRRDRLENAGDDRERCAAAALDVSI